MRIKRKKQLIDTLWRFKELGISSVFLYTDGSWKKAYGGAHDIAAVHEFRKPFDDPSLSDVEEEIEKLENAEHGNMEHC